MNSYNEKILIVEDDSQISHFIKYSLEKEGFFTYCAMDATSAFDFLLTENIDIVVLDLGLPDMDGIEVINKIREFSDITIIVVSARDLDTDKVKVLDMGADDYITKPFSANELMARIRVAIRHLYRSDKNKFLNKITIGDLEINFDSRSVFVGGNIVHLTPKEYALLNFLAKNIGKVVTTSNILEEIWGWDYCKDTQVLRTLMAGLRRKIEKNPGVSRYIITEIGVGYRLVDE